MFIIILLMILMLVEGIDVKVNADGTTKVLASIEDVELIRSQTSPKEEDSFANALKIECSPMKRQLHGNESYFDCKRRVVAEFSKQGEMVWKGDKYVFEEVEVPELNVKFPEHPSTRSDWNKLSEVVKQGLREDYYELKAIAERKLMEGQRKYRIEKRKVGGSKVGFHRVESEWGKSTLGEKTNSALHAVQGVFTGVGTGILSVAEWLTEGDYVERINASIRSSKEWMLTSRRPEVYKHADFLEDHLNSSDVWIKEEGFAGFYDLVFVNPNEAIEYYGHKPSGMPFVSTLKELLKAGDVVLVTKRGVCVGSPKRYPIVLDIDRRTIKRLRYVYDWEKAFDDSVEFLSVSDCFR